MTEPLPERASLDWLRKTAKQNLRRLRLQDPEAKLADAQCELARAYGFTSWRALKAQVDRTPDAPPDEIEISAFLRAVGNGEIESVRAALAAKPVLVNAAGPHPFWGGRPQALHVAIEAGRRDLFDLLIDAGADVNGRNQDYDQWSPIMLTSSRNREDMRETLLQRGARIGLVEAMMMADDGAVAALLQTGRGALPEAPNDGSLLAFARTPFAIDRLLALGVSPDRKDHWGIAPIEAMSRLGSDGRALVSHMIARGVTATPQEYARLGDRDKLAALIDSDPAIARSNAVMMGAVDFRHHDLVRWLLGLGADANAKADGQSHQSALHSAAWNGDLEMVRLLVESGADIHVRDAQYDATPNGWAGTSLTVTNNPKCAEVLAFLQNLA